ncbi:hypothetical protein D8674_000256 [Pyrus ussuriensis x Pyrus communis]|uniref:Uncharacterized protein n=1 Tax=Pyrus ussuriensis x Pyrus communis TaxID=2448454 RepID=A0A5N5F2U3_9ROSA|nr:hypothetical protein D8674_000256 [Pyrus ussuriensis x Pyrus communis]
MSFFEHRLKAKSLASHCIGGWPFSLNSSNRHVCALEGAPPDRTQSQYDQTLLEMEEQSWLGRVWSYARLRPYKENWFLVSGNWESLAEAREIDEMDAEAEIIVHQAMGRMNAASGVQK